MLQHIAVQEAVVQSWSLLPFPAALVDQLSECVLALT